MNLTGHDLTERTAAVVQHLGLADAPPDLQAVDLMLLAQALTDDDTPPPPPVVVSSSAAWHTDTHLVTFPSGRVATVQRRVIRTYSQPLDGPR